MVPFSDYPPSVAISTVIQGRHPPRPAHPGVTGKLWKLMRRCWDQHPHSRPEASEVLQILLDSSAFHSFWRSSIRKSDCVLIPSNPPAWKRLISPSLSANERIDLITSIFSDRDEVEVFEYLSGSDAQAFVDVMDEASVCILLPLKIGRSIPTETFYLLPVRCWTNWTASHQRSAGCVCALHTGPAAAKACFRGHFQFSFIMIQRKSHGVPAGLWTCGGVSMRAGRLRLRL